LQNSSIGSDHAAHSSCCTLLIGIVFWMLLAVGQPSWGWCTFS
jgi:hypothetical protein